MVGCRLYVVCGWEGVGVREREGGGGGGGRGKGGGGGRGGWEDRGESTADVNLGYHCREVINHRDSAGTEGGGGGGGGGGATCATS